MLTNIINKHKAHSQRMHENVLQFLDKWAYFIAFSGLSSFNFSALIEYIRAGMLPKNLFNK